MDNILKQVIDKIEGLISEGSSVKYAVSSVCKEFKINPQKIYNEYYKKFDINNEENKDIQTETININNNTLLPNMENEMKNLNEAQYNISINGLESSDAETLSQMLSLAGQAEGSNENPMNPMEISPMDAETVEEPTDLGGETVEEPADDSIEEPIDMASDEDTTTMFEPKGEPYSDIPFDEELPDDTEIPTEEPTIEDENFDLSNDMFESEKMDEDLLLNKNEADPSYVAKEKDGREDEDEEVNLDDELAEALRMAGIETLDESEEEAEDDEYDEYETCAWCGDKKLKSNMKKAKDLGYLCNSCARGLESREGKTIWDDKPIEEAGDNSQSMQDDYAEEISESDEDLDAEIAEALRLAGVEIIETKEEQEQPGEIITDETADSEHEYQPVDTDTFGKEASEGMKKPLTVESIVKPNKIESICEMAHKIYSRRPVQDWNKLDVRYTTKLIKEGCSYSRAMKLLDKAKKVK